MQSQRDSDSSMWQHFVIIGALTLFIVLMFVGMSMYQGYKRKSLCDAKNGIMIDTERMSGCVQFSPIPVADK